jgi:hypothetical protein
VDVSKDIMTLSATALVGLMVIILVLLVTIVVWMRREARDLRRAPLVFGDGPPTKTSDTAVEEKSDGSGDDGDQ